MSFKKMIPFLFGVTILGSGTTLLANSVSSNISKENLISSISNEQNNLLKQSSNIKLVANGGENYYKYYLFYHVIGLDSDLVKNIDHAMASGIGAVTAVLSASAVIIAAIAAVFMLQWTVWNIPGHDTGNGVVIKAIGGTIPQIIVDVSSQ